MDFEYRQVIHRFLDHDLLTRVLVSFGSRRSLLVTKDRSESSDIKLDSGMVNNIVKDLIHLCPFGKQQIASEHGLEHGIDITKVSTLLVIQVQCQAQARGINPTPT